jgi:hypothetical protein
MTIKEFNGKFIVEMLEKVLANLGISTGLPTSTKFLDYTKLDLKSFRIANRIRLLMSKKQISNFVDFIKPFIKVVEVSSNNKSISVEYIPAEKLNAIFKEQKI